MSETKEEVKQDKISPPFGIVKVIAQIFKKDRLLPMEKVYNKLNKKFQINRNGGTHLLHAEFLKELKKKISKDAEISKEEVVGFFTDPSQNEWYTHYLDCRLSRFNAIALNYSNLKKISFLEKARFLSSGYFFDKTADGLIEPTLAAMQAFELSRPGFLGEFYLIKKLTMEGVLGLFSQEFSETQTYYKTLLAQAKLVVIDTVTVLEGGGLFNAFYIKENLKTHKENLKTHFDELCTYYEKIQIKKEANAQKPKADFSAFFEEKEDKIKSDLDYHAQCWVMLKQNLGDQLKKLKKALVQLQEEEGQILTFKRNKNKEADPVWYEELSEKDALALPDAIKVKNRQKKKKYLKTSKRIAAFNGFAQASMAVFGFIALFSSMISTPYLILLCILLFIPSFFAYYKFTQNDTFFVLKFNHMKLKGTTAPQKVLICLLAGAVIFVTMAHSFVGMYVFLAHFITASWILSFASFAFAVPAGIFVGIFMLKFTYSLVVHWKSHVSDFLNFIENFYWGPLKIALKSASWLERLGIFPHLIFNLIKHCLGAAVFIIAALLTFENLSPMAGKFMGWFFAPSSSLLPSNINYVKTLSSSITAVSVGYWAAFSMAKVRGLTDRTTLRSSIAAILKLPFFILDFPIMLIRIIFSPIFGWPGEYIFSGIYRKIDLFCKKNIRQKTYSNTDDVLLNYLIKSLLNGRCSIESKEIGDSSGSPQQILRNLTPMQESAIRRKEILDTTKNISFGLAAGDNALALAVAGFSSDSLGELPPPLGGVLAVSSVFFARWGVKVTPKTDEEEADLFISMK